MKKMNLTHLAEPVRALVTLPKCERIACLQEERFVVHRRLKPLVEEIRFVMLSPPRTRASGVVVVGSQGSGKTMLSKAIERRYGAQAATQESKRRTHHALLISMTGARDPRALYTRMLVKLGAPIALTARFVDREQEVLRKLKEFDVRLLIVDEIQDLLKTTPRQQMLAVDVLKFVMNEASLPVLALGTEKATEAIRVDPHLAHRFRERRLPVWENDEDLQQFLEALEEVIPLRYPSHLSSSKIMKRLVELSKGVLLELVRLIDHAAIYAVLDGSERITVELIDKAWEYPPVEAVNITERSAA
jgi:hypothetical protein